MCRRSTLAQAHARFLRTCYVWVLCSRCSCLRPRKVVCCGAGQGVVDCSVRAGALLSGKAGKLIAMVLEQGGISVWHDQCRFADCLAYAIELRKAVF